MAAQHGCYFTQRGYRRHTCRELWPDNGPYAWCVQCESTALRAARKAARQVGGKLVLPC